MAEKGSGRCGVSQVATEGAPSPLPRPRPPPPPRARAHTHNRTHSLTHTRAALRHRLTSCSARPAPCPAPPPAGPACAQRWNHVGGGGCGRRSGGAFGPARPRVSEQRGSRAHPSPRSAAAAAATSSSFPSSRLHSPSQQPYSRSLRRGQGSVCHGSSAPAAGAGGGAGPGWGARGLPAPGRCDGCT